VSAVKTPVFPLHSTRARLTLSYWEKGEGLRASEWSMKTTAFTVLAAAAAAVGKARKYPNRPCAQSSTASKKLAWNLRRARAEFEDKIRPLRDEH